MSFNSLLLYADIHTMKRLTIFLFIAVGITVFPAAQSPGFGLFVQEGIASWYGGGFDGNLTASGEIFNSALFTAAHPTLPFGTIVTVTNTQNNRQVAVRVNDRVPAAPRIIELSRAAAEALDMLAFGTAPVRVDHTPSAVLGPVGWPSPVAPVALPPVLHPTTPPPVSAWQPVQPPSPPPVSAWQPAPLPPAPAWQPAPVLEAPPVFTWQPVPQAPAAAPAPTPVAPAPPPHIFQVPPAQIRGLVPDLASPHLYRLQVGSYSVPRNAVVSFERLRDLGLNPAYERHGSFYRVVLAGLRATDIPVIAQILGNAGYREVLIRQETGF